VARVLIGQLFTQDKNLDWFPRMRAMSLSAEADEAEQNELRNLMTQLEATNKIVGNLSHQLQELKEQVRCYTPVTQRYTPVMQRCYTPVTQRCCSPVTQRCSTPVTQRCSTPVTQR
jgi:hypothetical protein